MDPKKTETWFDEITGECLILIEAKTKDYGDSWRILRPSSLTDQIFIKAKRIRAIQETKQNLVGDPIDKEFVGIFNYSVMAIYNIDKRKKSENYIDDFRAAIATIRELLLKKDHDYGSAWRELRISSITDLILQKLMRLRQMEDNNYEVTVSEHAIASYQDIINYCVFALIHIKEGRDPLK